MKHLYVLILSFFAATMVSAQTYHNLAGSSLTQNWTNVGLITANDNWSGVPSIQGFLGQDIITGTGANPQTTLGVSAVANDIDVIANQTNPNTLASGGVAEFELTNPTIAIQGSGTADAPYISIYLNTTGVTNVRVQYKLRDIDGSTDNSIQPVALQYRIGNSGNFINVPAAAITDATSGPSLATQENNIDVILPAAAENQAQLELRIITTNAVGNDEWVGIDDIVIAGTTTGGDVILPTVSSLSPADGAVNVAINATATIAFSETIQKGTGNIYIRRASDNTSVQTLDVTTASVTVSGTQASFVLGLTNSTAYYIEVDAGAFKDIANNNFAGINGATAWNFTTVAPPATGFLGNTYNFNNCGNYINEGFTTYSVTGPQVWTCSKFGRTYTTDPSLDSAIEMNGFSSGAQVNEDWMISPKFDLTATNIPLLNFWTINRFAGPSLSLRVSTNYSGSGDPTTATWTTINANFPADNSNVWTLSDSINLSGFKAPNVYIAWVYTSTSAAAARWTLDDITVYNSTVAPAPSLTVNGNLLDFRFINAGNTSAGKTFSFYGNDLSGNLVITAPAGFEVSKTGSTYSSSISYTSAEVGATLQTAYIRFAPGMASNNYSGYLNFASTDINTNAIFVKGNSFSPATTLNVANWNIEWFGSTGNGPSDEALQAANAKKVMDALDADVYAAVEIVSPTAFANLVGSLNNSYGYVLSEHCSGGTTAGACASSQKLAFAYKTSVLSNVNARAMLITSTAARTNWASGRVPYIVTADVNKNGQSTVVHFIIVHAKANTGTTQDQIDSYFERKAGVQELKDSLDTYYADANVIIVGDYNDDLDRTIAPTTGADTVSSWLPLLADSTDGNSYRSISLPLSRFKLASTTTNPDVIDHVMLSNEFAVRYLSQSVTLYNDIETIAAITNFDGTTSDHYPILSRYFFGGTLPVNLVGFDALKDRGAVRLNWITSQESAVKEFVIEYSVDGRRFSSLGIVAATGSATGSNYGFLHQQPVAGNNFYRLRTVDLDGKWQHSRVVKVAMNKSFTVSLLPNPAAGNVTINLIGSAAAVQVELVNAAGQVVKRVRITNGNSNLSLDGLQPGLYLVRLNDGQELVTERLLVE